MPASDYKHKPGGGLKLKGGAADPTKKKKKKKSTSSNKLRDDDEPHSREVTRTGLAEDDQDLETSSTTTLGSSSAGGGGGSGKTKAQLKFEEVQRKRLLERSSKAALKSHKERVAEFNEQLEAIPQHYDIPKVGPG